MDSRTTAKSIYRLNQCVLVLATSQSYYYKLCRGYKHTAEVVDHKTYSDPTHKVCQLLAVELHAE